MTISYDRIQTLLTDFKLTGMIRSLDVTLESWKKEEEDGLSLLGRLLEEEKKERLQRKADFYYHISGIPYPKTIEQDDFSFQPSVDRRKILELVNLKFYYEHENVIFLGPPGGGKTHMTIALCMKAIEQGIRVCFTQALDLVDHLREAFQKGTLTTKMGTYFSADILVIDEIGYLPMDLDGAKYLFDLISRRYEKKSIILTSNTSFVEWGGIFGDDVIASAILDRLLHHSHIVNIKGKSYRLKEKQESGMYRANIMNESCYAQK